MAKCILKVIGDAACASVHEYSEMAGEGFNIGSTPEYWITTHIAQHLWQERESLPKVYDREVRHLEVEHAIKDLAEHATRIKQTETHKDLRLGRADISLWDYEGEGDNKTWLPFSIIEVKKSWTYEDAKIHDDIKRLFHFIREYGSYFNKGSIECGYFVYTSSAWNCTNKNDAKDKVNKRHKSLTETIEGYCERLNENIEWGQGDTLDIKEKLLLGSWYPKQNAMLFTSVFELS